MKGSRYLMQGIVWPLGVMGCVDGPVGPDVRVAEKIAGRNDDITERWDVVNGSKTVLRSLGVVRREMPFSVSVLGVYPSGVCLFHEGVPILGRANDPLVMFAQMKILFVVEEEVVSESGSSPTLSFSKPFYTRAHWV